MTKDSKIEWTDHTFNPWIGCTKVSPGCDHCYAESWAKRYGTVEWGAGKPRKRTSESNWRQPLKWNAEAYASGTRSRVFCASLADVFDNEVPEEWRCDLWTLIKNTPHLDWLLLTKRIGNVPKMLPAWWSIPEMRGHVGLGISVVNQEEADRDIPKFLQVPAFVRFLSMEPLLGPVDISLYLASGYLEPPHTDIINWVIVGGESGSGARPMHPAWARSLRDQCVGAGVAFHFKQHGEYVEASTPMHDEACVSVKHGGPRQSNALMMRVGKKAAGRLLDGRTWDEFPDNRAAA
jgi:protein gp37